VAQSRPYQSIVRYPGDKEAINVATNESPLKVQKATKERVRLGAAILACTQGEFVDRAVAEYLESHKDDFKTRVESAREALLGGDEAMLAYLRGDEK
jgi:hypothetical protein